MDKKARLIALYLPQYYPIPENNKWWGEGFTEWTNVRKARPLFPSHYQPHVPASGYYDLRDPRIRLEQAALAGRYGIEGFCYWHYWFGEGRRILTEVFEDVLRSGKPDYPFCLAWANASWTGVWYGAPDMTLIEQKFLGLEDYREHFYSVLPAFKDRRYMKVDGRPIFVIFNPLELPSQKAFIDCWRGLAEKEGLKGLYFIGMIGSPKIALDNSFDAITAHEPFYSAAFSKGLLEKISVKLFKRNPHWLRYKLNDLFKLPFIYSYRSVFNGDVYKGTADPKFFPCACPNWDNTPRCGRKGRVFNNSTPEFFREHFRSAVKYVSGRDGDHRIIFIKAWNEWAEGNHLEPDMKFGEGYLKVIKEEI